MIGWHHRLNRQEFDNLWETVKDREAWGATVHGITESGMTERLNRNKRLENVL